MERRTLLLRVLAFGVVATGAIVFVLPAVPRAQRLRLHLGAGSSRVLSVRARLGAIEGEKTGRWDREGTFRFPAGAPPSVDWSFEQENGKARVEVELVTANSTADGKWEILLGGGETTLELVDLMRSLA